MKKILNFSLCILLALSLSLGNVAPVVNAKNNKKHEKVEGQGKYGHIDVTVTAEVTTVQKVNGVEVEGTRQTVIAYVENLTVTAK